ncbi:exopolysaccharide biosynthesis protein, partial [Thioclava sp. BHET1]
LRLIATILVLSGGSLLVIGGIPIAAPILGLPIAVFALGLLSRDGAVVAAGYLLVLAAIATLALIALGG